MSRLLIALVVVVFPAWGELPDPGAGLATRADRRTARVTVWQAQYESLSAEQIEDQARLALQDLYEPACLLDVARLLSGDPGLSIPDAQEWVEDRLKALAWGNKLELLSERCEAPTDWPPEPANQGGEIEKTLVIRGIPVANGIRQMFPVLPRIGNVPPLVWGTMARRTCTVGVTDYDMIMSRHPWHESHLHLLEAIVTAEAQLSKFWLVNDLSELPCDEINQPE